MTNLFDKIKNIKDNFDFNMDDASIDAFPVSRSLIDNFKSIFNVKSLAVATLMGLSLTAGAADILPVSQIQSSFNDSLKIQNIYYNENLPTYFENKNEGNTVGSNNPDADMIVPIDGVNILVKNTDIVYKNEFWKNNIVTLVHNKVDANLTNDNDRLKYGKQIDTMNAINFDSYYLSGHLKENINQESANNFYNGKDDYKHYFKNFHMDAIKELLNEKNKMYLDDFITYHEMAHASFEQEASKVDKHAHLDLSEVLSQETHSDISSLLMVANKYAMNYDQFKDLTKNVIESRSMNVIKYKDFMHNSSFTLIELLNTFDNNKELFYKMDKDKISAFAAYFVHNVTHQDNKDLINNLKKQGIATTIPEFLDAFDAFRTESQRLHAQGKDIVSGEFSMPGASLYLTVAVDVYQIRHPEKAKALMDAAKIGNVEEVIYLQKEMINDIRTQDDKENQIFAVMAKKIIDNLDFYKYSTYLGSYKKPEYVIESHPIDKMSQHFSQHKKELNAIMLKNKS